MPANFEPLPRGANPFSLEGVVRGPDGIARYAALPSSLVAMLHAHVERSPKSEAVAEVNGERVTYGELWERAAIVAGGLRKAGVARGDRVAIRYAAGLDWVLAFFGTLLAGGIVVPVNTRFAEPEIEYVLRDAGCSYVFLPGAPLPSGEPFAVDDLERHDVAAIFYTSGTTGFPKGATTTHEAFLTNCENAVRTLSLAAIEPHELRTLISVPLFHVTGCNSQLLAMLYLGGSSVVLPALKVPRLLELISSERITYLVTVPAVYALALMNPAFAATDCTGVRSIMYGGAPMAPDLVHRLKTAFPNARVHNAFGMTETASLATVLPHEFAAEHADSVGFACPVVDFALDDVDPSTGVGELIIRGPNVTTAYWNKPDATAAALGAGWLRSGDLARIDETGLVYIVDRAKDMINRGGENVYCVEVENALAGAPGIAECAVIGVPDDVMGEKVGLVAVPLPDTTIDLPATIAALREKLADFKIPQYVAIRTTPLPRNPGGKIVKKQLREETEWGEPLR